MAKYLFILSSLSIVGLYVAAEIHSSADTYDGRLLVL